MNNPTPVSITLHTLLHALLLLCCMLALPVTAQDRLATLAGDGSVLLHSPGGEPLISLNPDQALIPASLLKIPLAQVALTTLGEDFRFETHFYVNANNDLLIRGLGDPFLVSEEIAQIANALAQRNLPPVNRLLLDDSAFEAHPDLPLEPGTSQPYGARNSALAVNFNTVNFAWDTDGAMISGEPQTPLTPFARELGATLDVGNPQRINLGNDPRSGLLQAQQLFIYFLKESGITVIDKEFYQQPVDESWTLFYRHFSTRSLRDILAGLLRYSNNFIANQLFLTIGAQRSGFPATVRSARSVLQQQLSDLYGSRYGSDPELLLMLEGSGLSRSQRSSGAAMMHILETFRPFADLLPEINTVLRKSGTLTGVYNFAGYLPGTEGLYPFVILTNQSVNNRAEILRILQEQL